jgi:tRNA(fMet)-specific endonuclease VapC
MDARFLLDTDICIYVHRRHPSKVLSRFMELEPGEAVLSVICHGELIFGAEKTRERARTLLQLEEFVNLVRVVPLPPSAAFVYGAIRADLEAKGEIIGNNDLWIAAHAKAADLTLVTNNEREFKRVRGLKIENWAK